MLAVSPMPPAVSTAHFSTQLRPSTTKGGAWNCVIKPTTETRQSSNAYLSLASLQPNSQLVVDVKRTDDAVLDVVAMSALRLVPGFRVIAPPMHFTGSQSM